MVKMKGKKLWDKICEFAVQAMLFEVTCHPSFGLVSPVSPGSHTDMDIYTFIESSASLIYHMRNFALMGYCDDAPKEIFKKMRIAGIQAEEDMFIKTKGINTHKGMIFVMGICCGAVSKVLYDEKSFEEVKAVIKEMTKDIVKYELENLDINKKLSHGEKLFLKYGFRGIRGEIEEGLPIVFDNALDFYDKSKNLSQNDRLVNTLVYIMQFTEDSTIVHRHDVDVLGWVRKIANDIIEAGGMSTIKGREMIVNSSELFEKRNISPGGSADLLAVTVFLSLVKQNLF